VNAVALLAIAGGLAAYFRGEFMLWVLYALFSILKQGILPPSLLSDFYQIWRDRLDTFTVTLLTTYQFYVKDYRSLLSHCLIYTDLAWKTTDLYCHASHYVPIWREGLQTYCHAAYYVPILTSRTECSFCRVPEQGSFIAPNSASASNLEHTHTK
jgi:hypothetical protein